MPTPSHSIIEDEPFETLNADLVRLLLVAAVAGCLVGLVGGAFHWSLSHGSAGFLKLLAYLKQEGWGTVPGWLVAMLIAGVSVALARWLVRFAPTAAGSGVQHVEAVMRDEAQPASLLVLPIKFIGGLLAMVPGLALGREGPTIQMAAVIGTQCGKLFGLNQTERSLLYTAIAGCGLSVAFNAPLSGAAFVIEEVAKRVTMLRVLATLTAIATAMAVYRGVFGNDHDFVVGALSAASASEMFLYLLLGMLMGLLGVFYNRCVLFGLNTWTAIARKSCPWIQAGFVGSFVGLLAYYQPHWVGGGEMQVNLLLAGHYGTQALLVLLVVRWLLGPMSYSIGTPGGLFAPLLLVGATVGALFANGVNWIVSDPASFINPSAFALVAMAAFFTGVVRAPITGILLICEMSGTVSLMIPLLLASVGATVVASLLKGEPIYDSLRARLPKGTHEKAQNS